MGILSKNDLKKAQAWGENILIRLDKGFNEGQTPATYLQNYAEKNLEILQHTLGLNYALTGTGKDKQLTLIDIAVIHAISHPDIGIATAAAAAIPALLKHSSWPNPHAEKALTLAYDKTEAFSCRNFSSTKAYCESMIHPFLKYKDNWKIVSTVGNTLAHFAIQYNDAPLLKNALTHSPTLLEARNINLKETPLSTAVRYKRDDMAKMLIEEYHADINAVNSGNFNVLANTIQFYSKNTLTLLLNKGCSINPFSNVIINEKHLECMPELMKAGYFIPSIHREPNNASKISKCLNIPFEKFNQPLFYIVSKDAPETFEMISSVQELKDCKLVPTDAQIQRLRASIEESVMYDNTLSALQKAFNEKFSTGITPNVRNQYNIVSVKPQTLREFSIERIIAEGFKNATSKDHIDNLNIVLKSILKQESIDSLTLIEHQRMLVAFSFACTSTFTVDLSSQDLNDFQNLIYKAAFKYSIKLIPLIVESSDKEFASSNSQFISDLFSIAANHSTLNIGVFGSKTIDALNRIFKVYDRYNIKNDGVLGLKIIYEVINAYFCARCSFYNELYKSLKIMLDSRKSFKDQGMCYAIDANILFSLDLCLTSLIASEHHLDTQSDILSLIEPFISNTALNFYPGLENSRRLLDQRIGNILNIYYSIIYKLSSPVFKYSYNEDNKSIVITFHEEYDKKKIRQQIRDIYEIFGNNNAYKLNYYGMSHDALLDVIHRLNAIREEDITPVRIAVNISETASSVNTSPQPQYYPLPPLALATRQPIRFSKPIANQHDSGPSTKAQPATRHNLDDIKSQIIGKLGLGSEVEVYQMEHPRYPESRAHLCWGIWIPASMSKRNASITDDQLERHHALLKDKARLEIPAQGASGFKIACFINTETNRSEYTYKTKLPKANERIVAVPYQVDLPSNEKATVYCFGMIDINHGSEIPKIDPRTFLDPFKKKVSTYVERL